MANDSSRGYKSWLIITMDETVNVVHKASSLGYQNLKKKQIEAAF